MSPVSRSLRERVMDAAEAVLAREGAVGPLELLQQIRFLEPSHVQQWRKGNEYFRTLEPHIQCGARKLDSTYEIFFEWVGQKKLEPFETSYARGSRRGAQQLQITEDGDPKQELFFRTQFRSPDLSAAKKERIEKKLNKVPDLVVYQITGSSSRCSECEAELSKGEMLFLERGQALCLTCADMDHLDFLPRGDATLTRRARKLSPLSAIVVRFSRARKRYERQGILVTPEAIAQAEQDCLADDDQRARRREQDAVRRSEEDQELVEEMTGMILAQYPGCATGEARRIAQHTAQRGSGRVGRSAAGRQLHPDAITLAVIDWIRHQHTTYDALLMKGVERHDARDMVREQQQRVLDLWEG